VERLADVVVLIKPLQFLLSGRRLIIGSDNVGIGRGKVRPTPHNLLTLDLDNIIPFVVTTAIA
jgi:hypothetical protein